MNEYERHDVATLRVGFMLIGGAFLVADLLGWLAGGPRDERVVMTYLIAGAVLMVVAVLPWDRWWHRL